MALPLHHPPTFFFFFSFHSLPIALGVKGTLYLPFDLVKVYIILYFRTLFISFGFIIIDSFVFGYCHYPPPPSSPTTLVPQTVHCRRARPLFHTSTWYNGLLAPSNCSVGVSYDTPEGPST